MCGRLRWLIVAAIAVSPVTVDLRRAFTWSEASAQDIWTLNCDPVLLNYYNFNQFIGSEVKFRSPPPWLSFENLHVQACRAVVLSIARSVRR